MCLVAPLLYSFLVWSPAVSIFLPVFIHTQVGSRQTYIIFHLKPHAACNVLSDFEYFKLKPQLSLLVTVSVIAFTASSTHLLVNRRCSASVYMMCISSYLFHQIHVPLSEYRIMRVR